jgi:hypothetical protein
MRSMTSVVIFAALFGSAACEKKAADPVAATAAATAAKCEHGVQKDLCARCNPKLESVFRAKNDWCQEHTRPESQCVLCNPELAKAGIK